MNNRNDKNNRDVENTLILIGVGLCLICLWIFVEFLGILFPFPLP